MRVHIDAGGREVTIECADANVSAKDIATEALAVWQATDGAKPASEGPAFGLVTSERSPRTLEPMSRGWMVTPKADHDG